MKDYFEEVFKILDEMTDEDFEKLLIDSGIEKCPMYLKSEVNKNV